jgi:hypothetical protein
MMKRWLIYLAVAVAAVVLYFAYRQWLAWLILVGILCLPVVGLVLSLPAMLALKLSVNCLRWITMGGRTRVELKADCYLPCPPVKGKVRIHRVTTGERFQVKPGSDLPTNHCGALICRPDKARVYDYLGLFFLRIRQTPSYTVTVYPLPVEVPCLPDLQRYLSSAWRPKPGGGYAENHELRLYRPGDNLNQIHWKLSAKTGSYIIREAMIPLNNKVLLTMVLRGTPEELDRKFGRLLWLSRERLRQELKHNVCVLTGKGLLNLAVLDEQTLDNAMVTLLSQPPAPEGGEIPYIPAAWQYRIGGGEDES